jgi:uncharacterized protein (TIGR02145 family)
MERKYSSLRLISGIISFIAWASLLLVFMEVGMIAVIMSNSDNGTFDNEFFTDVYNVTRVINVSLGLNAIVILFAGLISFVTLNSIAERIRIYIDIEQNTRTINDALNKVVYLLETKFEIKAEETAKKKSWFDSFLEWSYIIPMVLAIYFFISIFKNVPDSNSSLLDKNNDPIENLADYDQVKIGDQIWMTKNLDVDVFQNGDSIFHAKNDEDWATANENQTPAWCYAENNSLNSLGYGKLYNFYAVSDKRMLAPKGWHIPNKKELNILIDFNGGTEKAGDLLKNTSGWADNGNGLNSSEWNGLPGGWRNSTDGKFLGQTETGAWWFIDLDNESTSSAWEMDLNGDSKTIKFYNYGKGNGFSVRCIKDEE